MPSQNQKGELNWEVSVGVTFASFMSAVTLFFTGLLIAQFHNFDATIKVPLLLLIISTFSFIFAASIYSNAGIEITGGHLDAVRRYLSYANNILEFLGLYLFILATPLVIGAVTKDSFLRVATVTIALVGLALYSQSTFSILHKELPNHNRRLVLTALIVAVSFGLYYSQQLSQTSQFFGYNYIATLLLAIIVFITAYFCLDSRQYLHHHDH